MKLFETLAFAAVAWGAAGLANAEEVDVQLVLAADVSGSMSLDELRVQREGYVTALRSESVFRAVLSGGLGRSALTYVEWAGIDEQLVVVPWTVVGSRGDLATFADEVAFRPGLPTSSRGTSLSFALLFAARLFDDNGLSSLGRVIDVSGDGDNSDGPPMAETRDAIVSRGITINGISVALPETDIHGPYAYLFESSHEEIYQYYVENVIGGPGAFAMAVGNADDFAGSMERKLVLEIAGVRPDPAYAMRSVAFLDE